MDHLAGKNPIGYVGEQEFYRIKISRLLVESFMGMVPSKLWNGYASVHGGYIVVKDNGEIVCYHLSNRNLFEDYLLKHSFLDSYSTSRSQYASVEKDEKGLTFKLNLSIRMNE